MVVRVSSVDVSCKVRHRTAALRTSVVTSLRTAGTAASSVVYRNATPSECPGKVRVHCTAFGLLTTAGLHTYILSKFVGLTHNRVKQS